MRIQQLDINQVRNLKTARLAFGPHFNLILGPNGSGKTSLLEAIYVLGLGRSFRASKIQEVITLERAELSVSAQVEPPAAQGFGGCIRVGIEKTRRGETRVRLAEESGVSISDLVELLPTQLLNAESFQILEAGPQCRREFIDWGVFHVEQEFKLVWRRFKRALAQRNALLKQKNQSLRAITAWDQELVASGEAITVYRRAYLKAWLPLFLDVLNENMGINLTVECHYKQGWPELSTYEEALVSGGEQDKHYGSTSYGPHRADIQLKVLGTSAKSLLSRGQAKLFICAMLIARARLLKEEKGSAGIFLMDDLTSELDAGSCARLINALNQLDTQVFITGIEDGIHLLPSLQGVETRFFSVSHGVVMPKESLKDQEKVETQPENALV